MSYSVLLSVFCYNFDMLNNKCEVMLIGAHLNLPRNTINLFCKNWCTGGRVL